MAISKKRYLIKFTLLHLLTYFLVGMLCYQLQGYDQALHTQEAFKLYRSLESGSMVLAVFGGQILRGVFLAWMIYPFYKQVVTEGRSWLWVFVILWGLTALGSLIFVPNLLQGITQMTFGEFLKSLIIGLPEITIQMSLFSFLLTRRSRKRRLVISQLFSRG